MYHSENPDHTTPNETDVSLPAQLGTSEIMQLLASSIVSTLLPLEIVFDVLLKNNLIDHNMLKDRIRDLSQFVLTPEVKSMTDPVWSAIIRKLDAASETKNT